MILRDPIEARNIGWTLETPTLKPMYSDEPPSKPIKMKKHRNKKYLKKLKAKKKN